MSRIQKLLQFVWAKYKMYGFIGILLLIIREILWDRIVGALNLMIDDLLPRFPTLISSVVLWILQDALHLVSAFGVLILIYIIVQSYRNVPPLTYIDIDIERIRLSEGYSVDFPSERVQEYSFTVINESGADIKECYVVLDESARRVSNEDEWEIEQVKMIDTPFRWNKSGISPSGRLDIEDGDRASFSLGRSTYYTAMNIQTKKNVPFFQFTLTLHDEEENGGGYELLINCFYSLLITIHSKDQNRNRLSDINYDLFLRPTPSSGPAGGLEMQGLNRRK